MRETDKEKTVLESEEFQKIMEKLTSWKPKNADQIEKPKYNYGDVVLFPTGRIVDRNGNVVSESEDLEGVVEIIDRYGTFGQNEEPSYDLYNKEKKTLYKHIRQSIIIKKVRTAKPEERLQ